MMEYKVYTKLCFHIIKLMNQDIRMGRSKEYLKKKYSDIDRADVWIDAHYDNNKKKFKL